MTSENLDHLSKPRILRRGLEGFDGPFAWDSLCQLFFGRFCDLVDCIQKSAALSFVQHLRLFVDSGSQHHVSLCDFILFTIKK